MFLEQIKILVEQARARGLRDDYIINLVKEHLQIRVLDYLYNNKKYNNKLIFTGGTCLRYCFNLPRLSEDLDFDYEGKFDMEALKDDLNRFFAETVGIKETNTVIKGRNRKIYIKLPILKELSLPYGRSDILFLKVEPSPVPHAPKKTEITAVNREGLYFFIKRYSIADLMSGKIHAFLTRSFFQGKKNEVDFKGRDVFDLIWYMGQDIIPDWERLRVTLRGTIYEKYDWEQLLAKIGEKLKRLKKQHLAVDLRQFVEQPRVLEQFLKNYIQVFEQYLEKNSGKT